MTPGAASDRTAYMVKRQKTPPIVSLSDYQQAAQNKMSPVAREYLDSGAADEISLRRNRTAFDALLLKPRVLRDVSHLDTTIELLGQKMEHPILLAPAAYHKLFHRQGELATVRGAGKAAATLVVSSFATIALEEIARAAIAPLWFQLYMPPDRAISRDLVQRAEGAGYRAICMTVDLPVLGVRNREMRTGFGLPRGAQRANLSRYNTALVSAAHFDETGATIATLDASLTWKDVEWVRSLTKLPVLVKGILAPEDARLAAEHGAAGIIVSNHGARNLDTTPATIEVLPRIMAAVPANFPVLLDGGVRRGTDVVKALALGARAVLIGRPYLWALAVHGEAGVERTVRILLDELRSVMALCGRASLAAVDRSILWTEEN